MYTLGYTKSPHLWALRWSAETTRAARHWSTYWLLTDRDMHWCMQLRNTFLSISTNFEFKRHSHLAWGMYYITSGRRPLFMQNLRTTHSSLVHTVHHDGFGIVLNQSIMLRYFKVFWGLVILLFRGSHDFFSLLNWIMFSFTLVSLGK